MILDFKEANITLLPRTKSHHNQIIELASGKKITIPFFKALDFENLDDEVLIAGYPGDESTPHDRRYIDNGYY